MFEKIIKQYEDNKSILSSLGRKDIFDDVNNLTIQQQIALVSHHLQINYLEGIIYPYRDLAENIIKHWEIIFNGDIIPDVKNEMKKAPFYTENPADFKFIDLFAGIGGFHIPLQEEGGRCVFSSEFNQHAQTVYSDNYALYPFGDITKIPIEIIPNHDVLAAGFPCQPFSISGKMKGFEDTRGTLIYNVFKIIEAKKPKVVFLENVKHLVHHDHGHTLNTILQGLDNLGYCHHPYRVLNAKDFGVAQNRERIIIIASQTKEFNFDLLQKQPQVTIKDIVDSNESEFEYLTEPYTILDSFKEQDSGLIFVGYRNKNIRKVGIRPGTEHLSRVHKQPNRIYSINGVHPAIPSQETSGRFWIYDGHRVRKLTLNECYRLMGFPDKFIRDENVGEQYRQAGNAVCVPMIREIVKQIKKQML